MNVNEHETTQITHGYKLK